MNALRWSCVLLMIMGACVEPYDPPLDDNAANYLVVDGFLNVTDDMATVTLTRTLPVKSTDATPRQGGALVRIEDTSGVFHTLPEIEPGVYRGEVINADTETGYRVFIHTPDGHEYTSDYIEIKPTPPIDSITWSVKDDGVELAVNTHDPSGSSRHFRWKYVETFEYHATYNSNYMFAEDGGVIPRPFDLQSRICWKTNNSSDIIVSSTKHLSDAVVNQFPVTFIPFGSLKLTVKYSLLVQQQALTDEAYDYWLSLEKSTEHLGGLFDPLPSEVLGNIHSSTHPNEKVIGFFSGSTVAQARIFLSRSELPDDISRLFRDSYCALDTILNEDLPFVGRATLLVDAIYPPGPGGPIGYTTSETVCIDCTVRGGIKVKPPFWE